MTSRAETGHVTGTADRDYNLIWFTEACLSNALRPETYVQDAERAGDQEAAEFFSQGPVREPQGRGSGQTVTSFPVGHLSPAPR